MCVHVVNTHACVGCGVLSQMFELNTQRQCSLLRWQNLLYGCCCSHFESQASRADVYAANITQHITLISQQLFDCAGGREKRCCYRVVWAAEWHVVQKLHLHLPLCTQQALEPSCCYQNVACAGVAVAVVVLREDSCMWALAPS